MKTLGLTLAAVCVLMTRTLDEGSGPPSLASMPPVVIATTPVAGTADISPRQGEIRVSFSKPMKDRSWSWSEAWEGSTPRTLGQPTFTEDRQTCVLPVKLEPGRCYGFWLNSEKLGNFQDSDGRKAVPYLLVFETSPN